MAGNICDCCHKEGNTRIACSGLGPMSLAYCIDCGAKYAEPKYMFDYIFDEVSDNGDGVADHVKQMCTYIDGKYVPWMEYVQQRRANATVN